MVSFSPYQFANRHNLHFIVFSITLGLYRSFLTALIDDDQVYTPILAAHSYFLDGIALIPKI
ncbi:hypothetical protein D3C80_1882470 [compost metagenome]